jgi:gliding motility-associated-like protein
MKIAKTYFSELVILLIVFCAQYTFAQKQNNQWRFGNAGGIDFNTTPPSFVNGAVLSTGEGSASVADRTTGALLFYTDGLTVWNSQNQVMLNGTGLLGGVTLSSTTAAVIIPKPGSNNLYYIVTIDEQINNNGVRYSVVDMSLNGGLGDVVVGQKNILIVQTTSEKLEVVPASDGLSYWLITHDNPGNGFLSFKIDNSGIQTTPVVSLIGGNQGNGAGHMKINKQFNKIALGLLNLGSGSSTQIELFDFNNTTGVISNPTIWNYNFQVGLIYGVEFSPNGEVLYVSDLQKIVQYNISLPTSIAIENSGYQVTSGFYQAASLQLGIDDKIYINSGAIDAINCPNKLGPACGFQQNIIANQSGGGGYGLPKWVYYPNDVATTTVNTINVTDSCFGNAAQFAVGNTNGITAINWNFGDPGSANNTATGFNVNHTFSQIGNFTVSAFITTACGFDTLVLNALQIVNCNSPTITGFNILGDTCNVNTNFTFQPIGTSNASAYNWNFDDANSGTNTFISTPGNPNALHIFSAPGTYNVCLSFQEPGFPITTICKEISIGQCCAAQVLAVDSCLQNNIAFSYSTGAVVNSVSWNFNDPASGPNNVSTINNPNHAFTTAGNYIVVLTIDAACGIFTINYPIEIIDCSVTPPPCLASIIINDTCVTTGANFKIAASLAVIAVEWNFGDVASAGNNSSNLLNPLHLYSSAGTYEIRALITLSCGTIEVRKNIEIFECDTTPVEVNEIFVPDAFSPNKDFINDTLLIRGSIRTFTFSVFNRWGELVFTTEDQTRGWDGTFRGKELDPAIFVYYLVGTDIAGNPIDKKGNITLIK